MDLASMWVILKLTESKTEKNEKPQNRKARVLTKNQDRKAQEPAQTVISPIKMEGAGAENGKKEIIQMLKRHRGSWPWGI